MLTLLLEIYSEEIPINAQEQIIENLSNDILNKIDLENLKLEKYTTPIRTLIKISNIQKKRFKKIKGPKIDAGIDIIEKFLTKYKSNSSDLQKENEYFYITAEEDSSMFCKKAIEESLINFSCPKSMKWGVNSIKWIRPIKNILCYLDNKILEIKFGHITSSDITIVQDKQIHIVNIEHYFETMLNNNIILSPLARKNNILLQINSILEELKDFTILQDENIINRMVRSVEYGRVLLGTIDKNFLSELPNEIIIHTLKYHQNYLMLLDKNKNIAPYFIMISKNINQITNVIQGNEKLVRARLSDAVFFFKKDLEQNLLTKIDQLKNLVFHEELGSLYDKTLRVIDIIKYLANKNDLDVELAIKAAMFAKIDLVSNTVKEIPSLQGIMGYYIAINENKELALAIKDHYKPNFSNDTVPSTKLGAILAIADKIDTINQMFQINIRPTSTKDPYALRRAAIGIIRIIEHYKINVSFKEIKIHQDVLDFIDNRLQNFNQYSKFIKEAIL